MCILNRLRAKKNKDANFRRNAGADVKKIVGFCAILREFTRIEAVLVKAYQKKMILAGDFALSTK